MTLDFEINGKLYEAYYAVSESSTRNSLQVRVKRGWPTREEFAAARQRARELLADAGHVA